MLRNPGFEEPWGTESSHYCHVFPVGEGPFFTSIGNIFTPPGWVAWFVHSDEFAQPEGGDISRIPDPRRVHSGERAYKLFTFQRRHDAGLYQQIQVALGTHCTVTAAAHAWSNHKDLKRPGAFPHPDDPNWSEGVGFEERIILEGDAPALNGDPQNDAVGNFTFFIGIDPTGGTDPFADTVVWGRGAHIYNGYRQVPAVEAVAQATAVTVFLRSKTLWAFKHNDAYWDDVELICVTIPEEPEPPEEPEEEGNPLGLPRVQYERTYVLLPPDAGREWALAVAEGSWDAHRYTLGGSADDAGIGALNVKRIVAVNPGQWNGDLAAFFADWYPGVELKTITVGTPGELTRRLALELFDQTCLSQRDPRWADKPLGAANCASTIGQAGCFVTCLAQVLRYYDVDAEATPLTVNETLRAADGFNVCYVSRVTSLGLSISAIDTAGAREWVRAGNVALIEVRPTSLEHWVLATGLDEHSDDVWVCNPWTGSQEWLADLYPAGIESWRKLKPIEAAPPVELLVGLHDTPGADWMLQNGVRGMALAMAVVRDQPLTLDYRKYADAGIEVYLRLGWGYADGTGTIPPPDRLAGWIRAMAGTVNRVQGVAGVIVSNEWNNPAEWPGGWQKPSYVVTPEYCAAAFHAIRLLATADVPLALAALDPFNIVAGQFGVEADPLGWALYQYNRCLSDIGFIALHAKTQGCDLAQITGQASYDTFTDWPLEGRYMNLRTLEDQLAWVPVTLRNVPIVVTELNPQRKRDGKPGWDANGAAWARAAFDYVRTLNRIQGAVLYRFEEAGDQAAFGLARRPDVLEILKG